jgi:hypothetical protein
MNFELSVCNSRLSTANSSKASSESSAQRHVMSKTPATNPILKRLTAIALALPEARRELSGSHASFRVRKKTFAYFLNNHHGDGIVAVTCKVLPGENTALAKAQPKRYYLPAYIGSRGWAALRLDLLKIDWAEVRELLLTSYLLTAPKRLASRARSPDEI